MTGSVFVVTAWSRFDDGRFVGVYGSRAQAEAAISRQRQANYLRYRIDEHEIATEGEVVE